jgi:hypothetical protein
MTKIRNEDYTFVTNNRTDFTSLYAEEELHAGSVIIFPNVTPSRQRELSRASLLHIGTRNLINTVLEVDLADDTASCRDRSGGLFLWTR